MFYFMSSKPVVHIFKVDFILLSKSPYEWQINRSEFNNAKVVMSLSNSSLSSLSGLYNPSVSSINKYSILLSFCSIGSDSLYRFKYTPDVHLPYEVMN